MLFIAAQIQVDHCTFPFRQCTIGHHYTLYFCLVCSIFSTRSSSIHSINLLLGSRPSIPTLLSSLSSQYYFITWPLSLRYLSRLMQCVESFLVYSMKNLENAWQWVKGLTTGGSTNTLGALKRALGDSQVQAVYLLTDGRPDQVRKIVECFLLRKMLFSNVKLKCMQDTRRSTF